MVHFFSEGDMWSSQRPVPFQSIEQHIKMRVSFATNVLSLIQSNKVEGPSLYKLWSQQNTTTYLDLLKMFILPLWSSLTFQCTRVAVVTLIETSSTDLKRDLEIELPLSVGVCTNFVKTRKEYDIYHVPGLYSYVIHYVLAICTPIAYLNS